jgi:hypothetical protein
LQQALKERKQSVQGGEKGRFEIMGAWPVDVNDREGKVVCTKGERGGNGEVIDRVVEQLQKLIIPGRNKTPRGTNRVFANKGTEGRREEGGSKEGGNIRELRFLKAKNRWKGGINSRPNVISLPTLAKATNVPAAEHEFNQHGNKESTKLKTDRDPSKFLRLQPQLQGQALRP